MPNVEQIGTSGTSHAALFYPSMQDVWPEVYIANNVRIVEVRGVRMCLRLQRKAIAEGAINRGVGAGVGAYTLVAVETSTNTVHTG